MKNVFARVRSMLLISVFSLLAACGGEHSHDAGSDGNPESHGHSHD